MNKPKRYKITYFEQYINDYGCPAERTKFIITDDVKKVEFYQGYTEGKSICGYEYLKTLSIVEV